VVDVAGDGEARARIREADFRHRAMAGWWSLPWLRRLPQPALALMGKDNSLAPLVNGRILTRLIRNARLQFIDDGHLFFITKPRETAQIVQRLIDERCLSSCDELQNRSYRKRFATKRDELSLDGV
jgi:pimeloyl-ACP methyl ester carboxylesterase